MKKLDISRHYALLDEIQTGKLNKIHWDGDHPSAQRVHTKHELDLLSQTLQGYIKLIKPKEYSVELQAYIKSIKKETKQVDDFLQAVKEKQEEMHEFIDELHDMVKGNEVSYTYESYKEFYYLSKIVELENRLKKLEK